MKFLSEEHADDRLGVANTLDDQEIEVIFKKLCRSGKNDIFYDLGSGDSYIVRKAVTIGRVKKSHGIEKDIKRFLQSVESIRNEKEVNKIELWRADFNRFFFHDATIVLNVLAENHNEVELYDVLFDKKEVKIIKTELPLVGYKPVKAYRKNKDRWIFLMQTPFKKYKVKTKNEWACHVLGKNGKKIRDVYKYYDNLLMKREFNIKDRRHFLKELKNLVDKRLSD